MKNEEMRKIINEKRKANIKNLDIKNITSKDACIALSCNPAQELLKSIYEDYKYIFSYDRAHKVLIEIEKRLHRINKVVKTQTKVATAIYASSRICRTSCAEMLGITYVNINNLMKMVKLKKFLGESYYFDKM